MKIMELSAYSRLTKTELVLFDGQETFGRWTNPITDELKNNMSVYAVDNAHEGRPDLIANELYSISTLDWLLIALNGATDVLNWPRAGSVIRVPARSAITAELL